MTADFDKLDIPSDVKQDLELVVRTLCGHFKDNIRRIILFGSYAGGLYQPDSDVDVAVVLNALPDRASRRDYKHAVDIDRDLDFIFCTEESLKADTLVYAHINRKGIVLYEQL